jgi:hypothetical protein
MGISDTDNGVLTIGNNSGTPVATISSDADGNGGLAISNSSGTRVAGMLSDDAGDGMFGIANASGIPIAALGAMEGSGLMFLADQNGDIFEMFYK